MAMELTIENLRSTERILKNAYRAVRAASYSTDGSIEPSNVNSLNRKSNIGDIATVRFLMALANYPKGAAALIAYFISDYIQ
jgi:hypothetical protein